MKTEDIKKMGQAYLQVLEAAKPDFFDLDKDGNKKEPMKKAAADAKAKKQKKGDGNTEVDVQEAGPKLKPDSLKTMRAQDKAMKPEKEKPMTSTQKALAQVRQKAMGESVNESDSYDAMLAAKAHAKRNGENYDGDVSVQHRYDAYHMKKRGYTHFKPGRFGNRTYTKGIGTKITPSHHNGVSESFSVQESVVKPSNTPNPAAHRKAAAYHLGQANDHKEALKKPGMETSYYNDHKAAHKAHMAAADSHTGAMRVHKMAGAGDQNRIMDRTVMANKKSEAAKSATQTANESVIYEVSKKTLGSYIKKASDDAASKVGDAMQKGAQGDHKGFGKDFVKARKRQKGIEKAVDKLTKKESTNEATKPTAQHEPDDATRDTYEKQLKTRKGEKDFKDKHKMEVPAAGDEPKIDAMNFQTFKNMVKKKDNSRSADQQIGDKNPVKAG